MIKQYSPASTIIYNEDQLLKHKPKTKQKQPSSTTNDHRDTKEGVSCASE